MVVAIDGSGDGAWIQTTAEEEVRKGNKCKTKDKKGISNDDGGGGDDTIRASG